MRTLGPGSVSSLLKLILDVSYFSLWVALAGCVVGFLFVLLWPMQTYLSANLSASEADSLRGPGLALIVGSAAAYVGATLAIVGRLRRVFATLTAGDPFQEQNVRRLQTIGAILAGLELGRYAFSVLTAMLRVDGIEAEFSLTAWFAVLVVLVLAEVFREGARLRRDSELTI